MSLLIKSPPLVPGYTPIATTKYLTLGRLYLNDSCRCYKSGTETSEAVLDIFSGRCRVNLPAGSLGSEPAPGGPAVVAAKGPRHARIGHAGAGASLDVARREAPSLVWPVGGRQDAFDGAPGMLYLPPGMEFSVECEGEALLVIFTAPAGDGVAGRSGGQEACALWVPPEQTVVRQVGRDNWKRTVYTSIGEEVPARRLLVGETVNPPGNWSSSPPHKHDRHNPPHEVPMEEIYYFQVKPPQGFGFMRVYTAPGDPHPFDETHVVEDGDTVLIPRGYHPVVAGPGYWLHYTWALAGEERRYGAWSDDPRHAWIKD